MINDFRFHIFKSYEFVVSNRKTSISVVACQGVLNWRGKSIVKFLINLFEADGFIFIQPLANKLFLVKSEKKTMEIK